MSKTDPTKAELEAIVKRQQAVIDKLQGAPTQEGSEFWQRCPNESCVEAQWWDAEEADGLECDACGYQPGEGWVLAMASKHGLAYDAPPQWAPLPLPVPAGAAQPAAGPRRAARSRTGRRGSLIERDTGPSVRFEEKEVAGVAGQDPAPAD